MFSFSKQLRFTEHTYRHNLKLKFFTIGLMRLLSLSIFVDEGTKAKGCRKCAQSK